MLKDKHSQSVAVKQYLHILYLAAKNSEAGVDDALRMLIEKGMDITDDFIKASVESPLLPEAAEVQIDMVDLACYDGLLEEVASC